MAKIAGRPVIDALMAAGIADDNTRSVVIEVPVDGVPVIKVEKYADNHNVLGDVVEAMSEVDIVRRATSFVGGCKIQLIRATFERAPENGWRTYEPADAGAFLCDTHGVAVGGTWTEVQQALAEHVAPSRLEVDEEVCTVP